MMEKEVYKIVAFIVCSEWMLPYRLVEVEIHRAKPLVTRHLYTNGIMTSFDQVLASPELCRRVEM